MKINAKVTDKVIQIIAVISLVFGIFLAFDAYSVMQGYETLSEKMKRPLDAEEEEAYQFARFAYYVGLVFSGFGIFVLVLGYLYKHDSGSSTQKSQQRQVSAVKFRYESPIKKIERLYEKFK